MAARVEIHPPDRLGRKRQESMLHIVTLIDPGGRYIQGRKLSRRARDAKYLNSTLSRFSRRAGACCAGRDCSNLNFVIT